MNGLADPNHVVAGTRLRVPGHYTAVPSSAAGRVSGTHTVRPGETLAGIAARAGTSSAVLARMNGLADPNHVVAGTRLRVPGMGTAPAGSGAGGGPSHTVRRGDTMASIAARAGTTPGDLARMNGIPDPNLVVVGRVLRLPSPAALPAGVAPAPAMSRAEVAALLDAASARHGASASLVRALAWQESGWSQAVVSPAGAVGVMQLMPDTARWAGPALLGRDIDPRSAADNIDAGVAFLAHLVRATGDVPTALAAYNQGLESVRRRGPFDETRQYVASVLALVGRV
jgi:LysM repeat protein